MSRFDDGGMTGHGTVNMMVHGPRTPEYFRCSMPQFENVKTVFILICSKRCAAKDVVQLQGHTWRLRLQAAY